MDEWNSTTIQVFVRAGSLYETSKTNGISHFLEHMFFKWGKRYTTPKAVAQAVESFGWVFNAYTSNELASYYVKCPPQHTRKALDVLADMMINAQFPDEELQREKWVVIQEIKMYADRPQSLVGDKWQRRFYGDNPYGQTILWPEENIQSFTREDLFTHQQNLYTTDNMILVIAGKIQDQTALEDEIAKVFADLPTNKSYERAPYTRQLPDEQSSFYTDDTHQNHLILVAPWFPYQDEPQYYASKLMMTILGGNMSSRLFQNIREKLGLCYYIWARFGASDYDGLFRIRAGMDKSNFEMGVEKIYEEIETFIRKGITDQEVENAKSYLLGSLQMGIESSDELAGFIGQDYIIYNEINSLEKLIKSYEAISKEDIESVLPYLESKNLYLYHIE